MSTTAHRLSKQARREQLLGTAMTIVRTQGTDNLTLPNLAEAAGVSRPIVYNHFGTRSGLLLVLYRQLAERHRAASIQALEQASGTLRDVARVLSAAYFACATDMPEWTAISAALKGDPEMEAIEHEMLAGYTDLMVTALLPCSSLDATAVRLRCVGAVGAAEALAAELHRGEVSADDASNALTDLIAGSIHPHGATPPSA